MEASESEKVIQHLNHERQEAIEQAKAAKQKCAELQGLLDASKQNEEESAKQVTNLQSQVQKQQDDIKQKDSTILTLQKHLSASQEDVQNLCHSVEKKVAEKDYEINTLKGNLATLTSELEKWQMAAKKYEQDIHNLQNYHHQENQQRDNVAKQQASDLQKIQQNLKSKQEECASLVAERDQLIAQMEKGKSQISQLQNKLHQLEEELESCKKQNTGLSNMVQVTENARADLQKRLNALQEQHHRDTSQLQSQLEQSINHTTELQKEYEAELSILRQRCEQEKNILSMELLECQASLKALQEKINKEQWIKWVPAAAVTVAVAAYMLTKASN